MNYTSPSYKTIVFVIASLVVSVALVLLLGLYDIVKIEWISFMEVQPSFRPMEHPRPVATGSIPIDGAAYVAGVGDIPNPIIADDVSVKRGEQLYAMTCIQCHGSEGLGDGSIAPHLQNKPANLTSAVVASKSDGSMFLTITNGVVVNDQIRMPALNENLNIRDRWDLVNYIRSLQAAAKLATATPQP
jgi:mono/diheme cytochrome c family protein